MQLEKPIHCWSFCWVPFGYFFYIPENIRPRKMKTWREKKSFNIQVLLGTFREIWHIQIQMYPQTFIEPTYGAFNLKKKSLYSWIIFTSSTPLKTRSPFKRGKQSRENWSFSVGSWWLPGRSQVLGLVVVLLVDTCVDDWEEQAAGH